ncbi:MAG: hypothetical protein U1F65_11025 [Verrucomicrobiota bacterium]
MKWLFKWLLRIVLLLVILLALAVAAFFYRDAMLRSVMEERFRAQTGMEVKVGKVTSSIFSRAVTVQNLKLYNTAEFGGAPLLEIPELYLKCDSSALAQRHLRIELARVNVAQLNVVRNDAGQTNLFSLAGGLGLPGKSKRSPDIGGFTFDKIDVLNLSVGKVQFIDLKNPRKNREVRVNLENQIFKDVKSGEDLDTILFMIWLKSGGGPLSGCRPPSEEVQAVTGCAVSAS